MNEIFFLHTLSKVEQEEMRLIAWHMFSNANNEE